MPLKFLRVDSSFSAVPAIAVYFASAAFTRSSAFAIIGSTRDQVRHARDCARSDPARSRHRGALGRRTVAGLGKLDQLLGWVFIVAGIVILVSGRDRTGRMLNWFEGFPASAISRWCLLGIFFGGFLIYGVW